MFVKPDATKNVKTIKTLETNILFPETQKSIIPLFQSRLSGLSADLLTRSVSAKCRGLTRTGESLESPAGARGSGSGCWNVKQGAAFTSVTRILGPL